jgi:hypothetical protein
MNEKNESDVWDKMTSDAYFEDLFDAYRNLGKLHKKSKNPELKRAYRGIKLSMELGLEKITGYGHFARKHFHEAKDKWGE